MYIAKRSRRGRSRSSTGAAPTRTHDRISCVTNNQSVTVNGPSSAINFGSVPSLLATPQSSYDHSGMPLDTYSPDSYDFLWGNSTSDNHIPPMSEVYGPPCLSTTHGTSSTGNHWPSLSTSNCTLSPSAWSASTTNYSPHGTQPYRLKI